MNKTMTILSFVLSIAIWNVDAQIKKGTFGLFGSLSLPSGDFGDDRGEDAGLANNGYGGGFETIFPIGQEGLGWIITGSFLVNPIDESDAESSLMEGMDSFTATLDVGRWIHVPIFTGLHYQTTANPTVNLFGFGLIGINFVKSPKIAANGSANIEFYDPYSGGYNSITMEYDIKLNSGSGNSLGFGFGGGLVINDNITLSLRYLALGKPEIKTDMELSATAAGESMSEKEEIELEQSISIIQLTLGIRF